MLSVPHSDAHLDSISPSTTRDVRTDAGFLSPPQTLRRKRARSAGAASGLQSSPGQTPSVTIETAGFRSPVGLRLDLKSANLTDIKNVGTRGHVRMVRHEPTGLIMIQKVRLRWTAAA